MALPGLGMGKAAKAMPGSLHEALLQDAHHAAQRLRSGQLTSLELTQALLKRIEAHNPALNAIITLDEDQALEQARQADAEIAQGQWRGPWHGMPITIKDCFKTRGLRTTSGADELRDYIPKQDAVTVARLKQAGAIIIGKTNVSTWTGDWQTYNDLFGVTNNPWDLDRTPGGSTGGGAAALAAGLSFLSLGSDMGGSIRLPAHFCGIYGHKPSLGVVPTQGHVPPPPESMVPPPAHINVAGPLARSAQDLMTAMQVLGGPAGHKAAAYQWAMPTPRGIRLGDFRIGYVIDDAFSPVVPEVRRVYEALIEALQNAGVSTQGGWPSPIDATEHYETYLKAIYSHYAGEKTPEQMQQYREELAGELDFIETARREGYRMSLPDYQALRQRQAQAREQWQSVFERFDVFLMPVSFIPAFPHDHRSPTSLRKHQTPQGPRNYRELSFWISFASLAGLPATVAPIGQTSGGLPVGIQIVGPFLEDATPIQFAGALAEVMGGFQAPPDFAIQH